jgi:AhpD family alkylhydroperoxidase
MPKKSSGFPRQYSDTMAKHPRLQEALEALGKAVRQEGPIDAKTGHLIQLAASASIHSEGSVHSHTRRALDAGATPDEIRHVLLLLISTIGFPSVSAALSWVEDVLKEKQRKRT